jgi:hypothetical protein
MKKWTSVLAVFVTTLMVVGGAMAQSAGSGSGAAASGSGGSGSSSAGGGAVGTPGTPTTSGTDRSKAESPAGTPSGGAAASGRMSSPSASPATGSASADFTARHTMDGEVVKVDQKKGHVTLKTAEGNMELHFPPSALQNVKKGDRMSVELAMKPAGSASMKNDTKGSASPKTEDSKKKY